MNNEHELTESVEVPPDPPVSDTPQARASLPVVTDRLLSGLQRGFRRIVVLSCSGLHYSKLS